MSHSTGIILITAIDDGFDMGKLTVAGINNYLKTKYGGVLNKVSHKAGGSQVMPCDMHTGAFNYFDIDDFWGFIKTVTWEMPECVQLMIKDEHDDIFTVCRRGEE